MTEGEPVTEYYCRECGWLEPEFQAGDPALCPNCGGEYPPSSTLAFGGDGYSPASRERTWGRCGGWNADGSKCDRRTEAPYCTDHEDQRTEDETHA